jgi:hypothetical protein
MRLLADPKRLLAIAISSAAGVMILFSVLRPNPIGDGLLQVAQIVTAAGLLLGFLNVVWVHLRTLRLRAPGWQHSIPLIVAAISVFALELIPGTLDATTAAQVRAFSGELFQYVYQPLIASVLALLTVFALRASWRALYARPGEALVIVLVAVIFLVAGGPWAVALPGLQESLDWVRAYPVLGVTRGLVLGVALGALVATVRLLLGFDQPYLDR